ncbi:hypothetical protein D3C86_1663020 [compost metagenome]
MKIMDLLRGLALQACRTAKPGFKHRTVYIGIIGFGHVAAPVIRPIGHKSAVKIGRCPAEEVVPVTVHGRSCRVQDRRRDRRIGARKLGVAQQCILQFGSIDAPVTRAHHVGTRVIVGQKLVINCIAGPLEKVNRSDHHHIPLRPDAHIGIARNNAAIVAIGLQGI